MYIIYKNIKNKYDIYKVLEVFKKFTYRIFISLFTVKI